MTSISAHPVLLILKFDSLGNHIDPDFTFEKPSNFPSLNILPSLAEVKSSTFYNFRRGKKFNQEDLLWYFGVVRNSCDKELQAILDAEMHKYGPLYYFHLVHHMTNMNHRAIRTIKQELYCSQGP
jgi:hypothetical protein